MTTAKISFFSLSWRSLPTRVTLMTLGIFTAAIVTMAVLIEVKLRNDLEIMLGEQQKSTVSHHADELNRELSERLFTLTKASQLMVDDLSTKGADIQKTLEGRPVLPAFFNGGLFVTDAHGTAVASVPVSLGRVGLNFMERDHVASALKDGKSKISKPVIGKTLHSPVVSLAVPIRDANGTVIGSLVGVIDLGKPNFMDQILSGRYGKSGGFSIFAREWNLMVSGQDQKQVMRELGASESNPLIERFGSGAANYTVLRDINGEEILAAAKAIPVANWLLVASVPADEAFAPVDSLSRMVRAGALIAIVIAALLTWWLVRRQLLPIQAVHAALLRKSADANSDQLQHLPHAGRDEIGQLVSAFNDLITVLRGREATLASNEIELRSALKRMDEAQRIAHMGNWSLDIQNGELLWSDEIFRIFEIDPERFSATYEGFLQSIHPEDRAMVNKAYNDSLVDKKPYHIEHRLLMADGRIKWVQERCHTDFHANGAALFSKGTVQDITERKNAMRTIAESRDLLAEVIDAIPMRVFWKSPSLQYMGCNTAFARDAGKNRPQDVIGKDDYAMGWAEQADLYRADDMKVIQSGIAKLDFEEPQTTPDGNRIWLRTSKIPLFNAQRECFGVLGIYEDITERVTIAAELDLYRQDLEAKVEERTEDLVRARQLADSANQSKSEFLANMSHEIRTPMNGVVGMVDVLKQTDMSTEQSRMLNTIHKSSMTLLSILNDILDFSKIEAGKLSVETVPTPLREVVESVAQLMMTVADEKQVELSLFVDTALPTWVDSDPTRLRQVLLNLLSNGLKFSAPAKGKVVLSAQPCMRADGTACMHLSVADNGIGMDAHAIDNLFKPFTQADNSTMRKFGGTGLGLSISQRLVTMMGGTIMVKSTPQHGSRFTIELPLKAAEKPMGQHLPAIPDLSGISVLAVTPSVDCMTVFQVYLASAGARVRVVPDLAAAREHMNVSPSNTVLLLDLAQENGLTTDDAMQQQWANDQRVVRLVRHGRSGSETKVIEVRARPLIYHDLLNGVALACGRKVITDLVLHKEKEIPQRQAPGVEQARAQGRLVLLAEDNEINRDVIQEQLRLLGYAAEQAADGAIALEMWRSGRYALLLTDCHMPNMDGFELTANIRAAEQPGTHLPIIAITANAMQGEAERCRERGMDDYLSKPLRMVDLDEKLQHWLPFNGEKALAPLPEQAPVAAASPANGQIAWDSQALTRVVGNNQNMQKRLLEMFLEKAQSQVADITSAHAQSDMAGTASVAHTLKSAARTVGALLLSDACQAIETAARANDHTAVTALVPTLAAHLRAAGARIQEHLAP